MNGGLVSPTWGGIAVIESWLFVSYGISQIPGVPDGQVVAFRVP